MRQFVYTSSGRVELRSARERDIPRLIRMMEARNGEPGEVDDELLRAWDFRFGLLRACSGRNFVAELEDRLIGYAEVLRGRDPDAGAAAGSDTFFLKSLEVHDGFRRRKFGTEMVRYTMIAARNEGCRGYEVWPRDEKAEGLYRNLGFERSGTYLALRFRPGGELKPPESRTFQRIDGSEREPYRNYSLAVGHGYPGQFPWKRAFARDDGEPEPGRGSNEGTGGEAVAVRSEVAGEEGVILINRGRLYIYLRPALCRTPEAKKEFLLAAVRFVLNERGEFRTYLEHSLWKRLRDTELIGNLDIHEEGRRMAMRAELERERGHG